MVDLLEACLATDSGLELQCDHLEAMQQAHACVIQGRETFARAIQRSISVQLLNSPVTASSTQVLQFDPNRCKDNIVLSNQGRTAVNHGNKSWGTVISSTGCTPGSGVHQWAIQLDRCEKGHIFIGVCTAKAQHGTYLGHDTQSWGLIGTRALWHNRSKVWPRTPHGCR